MQTESDKLRAQIPCTDEELIPILVRLKVPFFYDGVGGLRLRHTLLEGLVKFIHEFSTVSRRD